MLFDQHQREALERLKSGSILVGGTGSGKSRTSLAYFVVKECGGSFKMNDIPGSAYSKMTKPKDLYIITTAAKRDKKEWEQELIPFYLFKEDDKKIEDVSIVVDSWNNISKYVDVENAFFIFDEQRVVGSGKWSKSFLKIAKKNNWILLTATPGDTWKDYIPVFIANGYYKNRTQFYTRHVVWSRYTTYPKIEKYIETDVLEKIKRDIQVEMKVDRITRPHRMDIITEYNKDNYFKIAKERWNIFDEEPIENAPQYMSCVRRVVNGDVSKLRELYKIFEKHKKLIIFYNFDYERTALLNFALKLEVDVGEWNGHNHTPVPESDSWLYLVQYNAGAEGWNCITTDTIVFFSLSYSYRMMHQAAGRIDRRNTPFKDLYYYYLYSDANVDKGILKALQEKRDFNERDFDEVREFYKNMAS